MGDPLVGLNAQIDWEVFRPDLNRIHTRERKSNSGAKPTDVVLMFKILVLQQLNNLSDDRIEYQIAPALKLGSCRRAGFLPALQLDKHTATFVTQ